jgi:sulfoxide reductase heme-binding subunit YedZ
VAGLTAGWLVGLQFADTDLRTQVSTGTAYVSLGCVAASLMLGPINLLRRRPNPVSSDLRRDLGIWGAVVGLVHVGFGLTVHFRGRMHLYFLPPPEANAWLPLRTDAFGGANHLGLVATLVLAVLLALSSDRALVALGTVKWKRWQRLNYFGAVAILLHGVLYQLLEKRQIGLVLVFVLVAAGTLALQLLGLRRHRLSDGRGETGAG